MNKVAAALALLSASSVMAAVGDACNNQLAAKLGWTVATDILSVSAAATDAKYCTNLKTESCCSAETINKLQEKANTLVSDIGTKAGARDKAIIAARKNALADITKQLASLKTAAAAATKKLGASTNAAITAFEDDLDFLTSSSSEFISSFSTYQKARVTCANAAIKLQTAVWCLACDPAQVGVTAGAITLDAASQTALENACYPYLTNAAEQNLITKFTNLADRLTEYTTALNAIASSTSGTSAAVAEFVALVSGNVVTKVPTAEASIPVALPTGCDAADDCDWILDTLFDAAQGGLDKDALALGGELIDYEADDNENENENENSGNRRVLAAGTFTPNYDNVGITVSFPENPGNVANTKSAQLIEGAVVCAGVLAMGLMI